MPSLSVMLNIKSLISSMVPVMDEVLTSVSAEEASAEGVSADSETCVETVSSAEETG